MTPARHLERLEYLERSHTIDRTRTRHHRHPRAQRGASIVAAPRRASEATYRRRRALVGTALAAFIAVGAVATYDVLAGSGSVPASAAESQPARAKVVVGRGDTLWSIARTHRGDVSLTRYVDKLVALNGGPTIHVGQEVELP